MDIEPATIEQVRLGKTGRVHTFSAKDSQVAADLAAIAREANTEFILRFNEESDHYSVVQKYGPAEDDEQLVATCQCSEHLPLVVTEIRHMVMRPDDYDLVGRLDRNEAQREKALADETEQRAGEWAQEAFHRMRKAEGRTDRIIVPKGL